MSDLSHLLDGEPIVATAGTDMLAESIEQQGAEVIRSDWRPPEPIPVWAGTRIDQALRELRG